MEVINSTVFIILICMSRDSSKINKRILDFIFLINRECIHSGPIFGSIMGKGEFRGGKTQNLK